MVNYTVWLNICQAILLKNTPCSYHIQICLFTNESAESQDSCHNSSLLPEPKIASSREPARVPCPVVTSADGVWESRIELVFGWSRREKFGRIHLLGSPHDRLKVAHIRPRITVAYGRMRRSHSQQTHRYSGLNQRYDKRRHQYE